ncbi:hypothetical protein [Pectobacterium carotovorum]|uniref:hypothetical protein n=1 Tax=Pectobacterium carotovorum TaxID=554 RepID=UPI00091C7E2F|nr:hypothetical protein [Pectobacterium carotovorum]SHH68868.1 hypothetical protein SAMN05444147_11642 [Pectobacterium carotovorum]
MSQKTESKKAYSNTVYVAPEPRKKLEELITEIGYKRGRVMSASGFVRYLIENCGEDAKRKILENLSNE